MPSIGLKNQIAAGNHAPFLPTVTWAAGFTGGVVPDATAIGTTLATVGATDPDGDAITYAIHSDPDSVFSITGTSLKLASAVDHTVATSHSVTVRATDTHGAYVDNVVAITVTA
jgi:Cadherin domain